LTGYQIKARKIAQEHRRRRNKKLHDTRISERDKENQREKERERERWIESAVGESSRRRGMICSTGGSRGATRE